MYHPNNSPVKHSEKYPLPSDPSGCYVARAICDDLAKSGRNFVKVSGSGSQEVDPDIVIFCIKITSRKSSLDHCRASIKKREDYIVSILKKNSVKKSNSVEIVYREEAKTKSGTDDERSEDVEEQEHASPLFTIEKEISAQCDNLVKFMNVSSVCEEKLDSRVEVSQPVVSFSAHLIEKVTQSVLDMAKKNARSKALTLIRNKSSDATFVLGPLLYAVEDSSVVENLRGYENSNFKSLEWKTHSKLAATQITAVYEINTQKDKNARLII